MGDGSDRTDGTYGILDPEAQGSVGSRFGPLGPTSAHSRFCLRQFWNALRAGIAATKNGPGGAGPYRMKERGFEA